jgi:hypothetical protein
MLTLQKQTLFYFTLFALLVNWIFSRLTINSLEFLAGNRFESVFACKTQKIPLLQQCQNKKVL